VNAVHPRLETLPPAQRIFWPQLSVIGSDFVLYGGTGLSLQVGGRTSVDFDFFSAESFNFDRLVRKIPFLSGAIRRTGSADTARFIIDLGDDEISISFFGGLTFGRVSEPVRFSDNGLFAAGLLDLAAQKVIVIQQRAEAKDYLDIHKLLSEGVTLEMALGAAQALHPEFNPTISLKALSYFDDVSNVPQEVQRDLRTAASRVRDIAQVKKQSPSLLPGVGSIEYGQDIGDSFVQDLPLERSEPELEI
jgi:hypothetical protein